ncbi:MAG: apolipoprotein N-acyltransferase [Actinobacteria bacterium]|nr:apolipoprotein N-acyltransferase [Actinomycetota bacterium]
MVSWRKGVMSALAGLSFWLSFAPHQFWPGAFLGGALLFRALVGENLRERFIYLGTTALCFFLPLLSWSGHYVGPIPWIALALLQSSLFLILGARRFETNLPSALAFASLFTFTELLRMKVPFGGFGWGRIGFTQVQSLWRIYPWIGITGISFLVILIASLIATRELRALLLIAFAIFSLSIAPSQVSETSTVSVDAVQGGVEELGLHFNSRALSVLTRHVDETVRISKPGDLILWPENSSDIDPIANPQAAALVNKAIASVNRPILVGAVEQGSVGPSNTSLLFSPQGKILSRYIKQDLAPFGEYIPLRKLSEYVTPEAKLVANFKPGSQWVKHQINGLDFVSVICFEILDDDLIHQGASKSNFLVAQTNNATFGRSAQASQQLQITAARAAELKRQFAVVSTTGWTAQINEHGAIIERLPQFKPGYLAMQIQGFSGETPASRIPSWLWMMVLGVGALVFRRNI